MTNSRSRTQIWIGLEDDDEPEMWEVHTEDDMLMIETMNGDDELDILISPKLFPRIKEIIDRELELGE